MPSKSSATWKTRCATRRATRLSGRADVESIETLVESYRFDDQDASPLDCAASFCSTASIFETVRRKSSKNTVPPRWPDGGGSPPRPREPRCADHEGSCY